MKILDFDKFGRYRTFYNTIEEAKQATGNEDVFRTLFREGSIFTAKGNDKNFGHIFTLENDERIVRDVDGKVLFLDCLDKDRPCRMLVKNGEGVYARYMTVEDGVKITEQGRGDVIPNYNSRSYEKKFDNLHQSVYGYRILYDRASKISYLIPIGIFESVGEARKKTNCSYIYSVLCGEYKSTSYQKDDESPKLSYFFTKENLAKIKYAGSKVMRSKETRGYGFISNNKTEALSFLIENNIL